MRALLHKRAAEGDVDAERFLAWQLLGGLSEGDLREIESWSFAPVPDKPAVQEAAPGWTLHSYFQPHGTCVVVNVSIDPPDGRARVERNGAMLLTPEVPSALLSRIVRFWFLREPDTLTIQLKLPDDWEPRPLTVTLYGAYVSAETFR